MTKFSAYLKEHNISSAECAKLLKVEQASVTDYRRRGIKTLKFAQKIAKCLFEQDVDKILEYPKSMKHWIEND